ncbi:pyruvate kinase [Vibrio sinaloensis]|nr:pyruvate kinase [Vibrio sinaloensis]
MYFSTRLNCLVITQSQIKEIINDLTPKKNKKIVSTLGPSTDKPGMLEAILEAGVNVVRMNFSHGSADDHRQRATRVRNIAAKLGTHVAILGDLQGPKIRVSTFAEGKNTPERR